MSEPIRMEDKVGSVASGYKQTLRALGLLLKKLNEMQEQGVLAADHELDNMITAAVLSMLLGKRHFPSLQLLEDEEDDYCPICEKDECEPDCEAFEDGYD